jgi:hypothetical protein
MDSRDSGDAGDASDEGDAIRTSSQPLWPATELDRFGLGTSDVDGYEGKDGDDADEEDEASLADDGSMQNVAG